MHALVLHVYQAANEIWSTWLHQFQRYDWGKFKKRVTWPWPRPFYGWFVIHKLGYDIVCLCTKFDDSSFSHFKDMTGARKFKMGHVILNPPFKG